MKRILKLLTGIYLLVQFTSCSYNSQKSFQGKTSEMDSLADTWELAPDINGIRWNVNKAHTDHLEFSGLKVSALISYGNDGHGELVLEKKVVWPMLRTIPNDTHASLIYDFDSSVNSEIKT